MRYNVFPYAHRGNYVSYPTLYILRIYPVILELLFFLACLSVVTWSSVGGINYLPMAAIAAANIFNVRQFSKTATDSLNTHMQ